MPGQECDIVMHKTVFRTVKIAGKVGITHSCCHCRHHAEDLNLEFRLAVSITLWRGNMPASNLLRGLCYGPVGSRYVNGYGFWCGQLFPEPE